MQTSRRRLIGLAAAGAAGAAGAAVLPAGAAQAATRSGSPAPLDRDPVLHLLRRATYGPAPADVAYARRRGARAWLEQQLTPERIPDRECDAALAARYPWLRMTPAEMRAAYTRADQWRVMAELPQATLIRAVTSKRQLFEVMVEFWDNHLNVTCPSDGQWEVRALHDREVVRAHALGRFEDMLLASATSPAMLRYLDGASSRGTAPNENYGRELLELHTVGVHAGYTERDVAQSALALTGLTIDKDTSAFRYRPEWHHVGPLQVLGWSSPNGTREGGLEVAADYLRYLARHPATARRIAHKLAVRFVADDPPPALVERLAAVYLTSGTDVRPVLRALFASREFAASVGGKTRRPYEDAVATLRAVGVRPTPGSAQTKGWSGWLWAVKETGQAPHGWAPPDGYPDVTAAWQSTSQTLARVRLHQAATGGWFKDGVTAPDARALLGGARPATAGALIDLLSQRLLHQRVTPAHRAVLAAYLGLRVDQRPPDWVLTWKVRDLACLLLDSPYWSLR